MAQSHLRNNPSTDRPRINWPSAGQILRQIVIVAVIVAIWAAALVAYLQLTGGPDKVALAPNTPTPIPTGTPTPTPMPTVTPTSLPTDTPTAAPAPTEPPTVTATSPASTPTSAPEAIEPSPTQEPSPVLTSESSARSTSAVSFAADVAPLLGKYCIRCHGASRPRAGLSLASYRETIAGSSSGPVVAPGDAEASLLAKVVLSGEMPPRGEKPTDAEIQTLVDWINGGALDN